jgi:hypothetical protein
VLDAWSYPDGFLESGIGIREVEEEVADVCDFMEVMGTTVWLW